MLYENDRMKSSTTPREQIVYRIAVEGIVGIDDHLHRFEWVPQSSPKLANCQDEQLRRLGIQLLNKEDLTLDQATTREEQWAYYVDSYYMHADTEGVATEELNAPVLRRLRYASDASVDGFVANELQVKICLNTYKLFYLVNTEDTLIRGDASRAVEPKKYAYDRAVRIADGLKWTRNGYHTKEEQDAAATAAAEAKEQEALAPPSIEAPPAPAQQRTPPASETSAPPPEIQPPVEPADAPSTTTAQPPPEATEPAANDVKVESPSIVPHESGEAMDIDPVQAAPSEPQPEHEEPLPSASEDVEMQDA